MSSARRSIFARTPFPPSKGGSSKRQKPTICTNSSSWLPCSRWWSDHVGLQLCYLLRPTLLPSPYRNQVHAPRQIGKPIPIYRGRPGIDPDVFLGKQLTGNIV